MNPWFLLLSGWAVMAVIMTVLWVVQRRTSNAGIVDIAWSFGTGLLAVWFAFGAEGYGPRRLIIAILAGLWGCRLGFFLLRRVLGEAEDGRYRMLREQWGDRAQFNLFWFFQVQAFWAMLFAAPMLVAALNPTPELGVLDLAGIVIWCVAVLGESIADAQLARFRARPESRGQVCRDGLWRYSRHPNYFFEWIHWWAYVALGIGWTFGWLTLFGPVVMLVFLLKLTGIPYTERRAIESRGDAYRDYQRTTSKFFPWPPKAEVAS